MKRNAPSVSATSSSSLASARNPPRPSKCTVTGFLHGIKQLKQRSSSLSTEVRSSESMDATSHSSSCLSTHHFTARSSSMTVPCATELLNDETSCSPISPSSWIYTSSTSKNLASLAVTQKGVAIQLDQVRDARMLADVSTRADAPTRKLHAPMPTCAQNVATICTLPTNARQRLEEQRWENRPRYVRGLVWTNNNPTHTTLATYTETMPALPSAPTNELNNPVAHATIRLHLHLFQLITPINIDCLESLLTMHPNQALVRSIILGFRQGFWPFTITENAPHPSIVDNSTRFIQDPAHVLFVCEQRDYEIQQGRFSPSFGQHLLPGMTAIPISVVPKPHSNKLWLVVDQSSGDFAPNSFIPRQSVAVPLDNLQDLGAILHCIRVKHGPSTKLVVFKSDVSQAY